jgi:hypothetical protein
MKGLIKKYVILLIIAIILARLSTIILLVIFPNLLTTELPNGGTSTLGSAFLERGIEYLLNIVFIVLLSKEMKKLKFKSHLILITTFLSSFLGVIFFLFIAADNIEKTEIKSKI